MEIWKDIEGYEGIYQVSNLGRVKSLPRYHHRNETILKNKITKGNKFKYFFTEIKFLLRTYKKYDKIYL